MNNGSKIRFKDPDRILVWIDSALKHEKLKYEKAPVTRDLIPEYEMGQGWGFVVAAYSLLEQSMKALIHLRGNRDVPIKHSLTILFDLFETKDKEALREFYSDYRATANGMDAFAFATLDEFIENLDGDPNRRGDDRIGSFDWRYSPIEEARSQTMPTVSIDFLHEIIRGCYWMASAVHHDRDFDPLRFTNSWLMQNERILDTYRNWHTYQLNKPDSDWMKLGDRIEILWGPDYLGRYDWELFGKEGMQLCFAKLPEDSSLQVIDRREEIQDFDAETVLRSIGIGLPRPPSHQSELNSITVANLK